MKGRYGEDCLWVQAYLQRKIEQVIAVAEMFRDRISLAERTSDLLMAVKIHGSNKVVRVVTGYAPQAECCVNEKDQFWTNLGDYINTIPKD